MQNLHLDYARSYIAYRWIGYVILMVSLIASAGTLVYYQQLKAEINRIEIGAGLLNSRSSSSTASKESPEQIKQIKLMVQQLMLPWADLFTALEKATMEQVTLLSVQPDLKQNSIKIMAEAKDEAAMLEYLRRLNGVALFTDVHLLNHQIKLLDSQALQFTVAAVLKQKL